MRGITWITADPWHYGHTNLVRRAKEVCDELIVCVSTSEDIERRKGRKERFPLEKRLEWVKEMRSVDIVGIQDPGFSKADAVSKWNPDAIFVSDEYMDRDWEGKSLGVTVIYLPYTQGVSSTSICE